MKKQQFKIVLNGEWYQTANSWEEALAMHDKLVMSLEREGDVYSYVQIIPVE